MGIMFSRSHIGGFLSVIGSPALTPTTGTPSVRKWHRHQWVDARNEVIESGEVCIKCWAVRAGNSE